jgi:hypothetical protein
MDPTSLVGEGVHPSVAGPGAVRSNADPESWAIQDHLFLDAWIKCNNQQWMASLHHGFGQKADRRPSVPEQGCGIPLNALSPRQPGAGVEGAGEAIIIRH